VLVSKSIPIPPFYSLFSSPSSREPTTCFSQRFQVRVGEEFVLVNLVATALEGIAGTILRLVWHHHLPQSLGTLRLQRQQREIFALSS
jgi:hypothetical protein